MTRTRQKHEGLPAELRTTSLAPKAMAAAPLFCIDLKAIATGYLGPYCLLEESLRHYKQTYQIALPPVHNLDDLFQHPTILPFLKPMADAASVLQQLNAHGAAHYTVCRSYHRPTLDTTLLTQAWLRRYAFPRPHDVSIFAQQVEKVVHLGKLAQQGKRLLFIDHQWSVLPGYVGALLSLEGYEGIAQALQERCTLIAFGIPELPRGFHTRGLTVIPCMSWEELPRLLAEAHYDL